jgi:hypothetical protein
MTLGITMVAALLGGCTPANYTPPPTLSQQWMIGVEAMDNDPVQMQPFTNRFMAALAGMPKTQLVWLGSDVNAHRFSAYPADKLLVRSSLRANGSCMQITYTVMRGGQNVGSYGLVIAPPLAGVEPTDACVDRAASEFYRELAQQGL